MLALWKRNSPVLEMFATRQSTKCFYNSIRWVLSDWLQLLWMLAVIKQRWCQTMQHGRRSINSSLIVSFYYLHSSCIQSSQSRQASAVLNTTSIEMTVCAVKHLVSKQATWNKLEWSQTHRKEIPTSSLPSAGYLAVFREDWSLCLSSGSLKSCWLQWERSTGVFFCFVLFCLLWMTQTTSESSAEEQFEDEWRGASWAKVEQVAQEGIWIRHTFGKATTSIFCSCL